MTPLPRDTGWFMFAVLSALLVATTTISAITLVKVSSVVTLVGIDINRADPADLESLPEIGDVLAAAIVQWRRENRDFINAADVDRNVEGIGPKRALVLAERCVFIRREP